MSREKARKKESTHKLNRRKYYIAAALLTLAVAACFFFAGRGRYEAENIEAFDDVTGTLILDNPRGEILVFPATDDQLRIQVNKITTKSSLAVPRVGIPSIWVEYEQKGGDFEFQVKYDKKKERHLRCHLFVAVPKIKSLIIKSKRANIFVYGIDAKLQIDAGQKVKSLQVRDVTRDIDVKLGGGDAFFILPDNVALNFSGNPETVGVQYAGLNPGPLNLTSTEGQAKILIDKAAKATLHYQTEGEVESNMTPELQNLSTHQSDGKPHRIDLQPGGPELKVTMTTGEIILDKELPALPPPIIPPEF